MNNQFDYAKSSTLNAFLSKTYGFMGLGVLVSAISAYAILRYIPNLTLSTFSIWAVFGITLIIAFTFNKVTIRNPFAGAALFTIFSVLEGFSLSSLAFVYTGHTIGGAFASASAIFLLMAFFGSTTKLDLSKIGTYFMIGLIGMIIVSLVNLFLLKSSGVSFIISIISVILFTGLAGYDAQNAVQSYRNLDRLGISENSMAVLNAFNLYLDFVNIFVNLVEIFGAINSDN